jgi:hypothetical protein
VEVNPRKEIASAKPRDLNQMKTNHPFEHQTVAAKEDVNHEALDGISRN